MVSCCTRKRILHSRMNDELDAVRGVFGRGLPVFGFYSGGEIVPYESRYAKTPPDPEGTGSRYHATTVALLAISAPKRARRRPPAFGRRADVSAPRRTSPP